MSDDLSTILYGKTAKVKLADGNLYQIREPDIDTLEKIDFDIANVNDIKNVKRLAYILLKEDNIGLTEGKIGKLITFSMLSEGSEFLKSLLSVLTSGGSEKNGVAGTQ